MENDNFSPLDETIAAGKNKKERDYWKKQLSGDWTKTSIPTEIRENSQPPPAGPGPALKPEKEESQFPSELNEQIIKISGGLETKIYMLLLTGMVILLERYTGSSDIIVAAPVLKQQRQVKFINTLLALRNRIQEQLTFKELLQQVRQTVIQATEHQNYPLKSLVTQLKIPTTNNGFPLFDIGILLENIHERKYLDAIPLNMIFSYKKAGNRIEAEVEYNPLRYTAAGVQRIMTHYSQLLQEALTAGDKKITSLEMLSKEEKRQILEEFNQPPGENEITRKTPDRLYRDQEKKTPDAIAVVSGEKLSVSYRKLQDRASRLAGLLQAKGVGPGSIVGLMVERSIHMIVGILAILKAGAAYLPMDSQYPGNRNRYILQDSQAGLLLTQTHIIEENAQQLNILPPDRVIPIENQQSYCTAPPPTGNPGSPANPAYIIYTSGTTGKPKGVIIEGHSIANLVNGLKERIYNHHSGTLHVSLLSPYVFDASVKQIFGALLQGHCIHVVPTETRADGQQLLEYYNRHSIDISDGTPIHIRMLSETIETTYTGPQQPPIPCPVKRFIIGGEPLPRETALQFLKKWKKNPPIITNVYGPTETCVDATLYHITSRNIHQKNTIPIGRPLPNYQVYILDNKNRHQPVGLTGELCIGGKGTARGYLNQPELTKQKFCLRRPGGTLFEKTVPVKLLDPPCKNFLLKAPNQGNYMSYIYHSGDQARWLPDGNIEFLGRSDQQVKIRGFRVEIGEIENELLKCETVSAAIVTTREDNDGDKYLCAYIVPANPPTPGNPTIDTRQVKEFLSQKLPLYLVPLHIIPLEKIPITHNGKVDRNRLPEPGTPGTTEKYEAPRDEVEKKLTGIWAGVLGIDRDTIGIDSNFFRIGGHSLKATIQITKIHKAFDVKVPLAELFNSPTIRELSTYIKGAVKERFATIEPEEEKEYHPASPAQERLYVIQQMEEQSTTYNMPRLVVLEGELSKERLQQAINRLIKRHEILRTSFTTARGVVQKIHPAAEFEIENYEKDSIHDFIRPFDLAGAPLLRVGIKKTRDREYILMIDMHHIISDAISQVIFVHDIMILYGGGELQPLKLQYRDYSAWQNRLIITGQMKKQEEYWHKIFTGEIPLLDMPLDYPRPPEHQFKGQSYPFDLENRLIEKIHNAVTRGDTTLNIFLLAVYNVLLSKYTGQNDIIVGIVIAGRRHADLEEIIGFFVNMLALRNQPGENKTFAEFLTEVKENSIKAYENQEYQFQELVATLEIPRQPGRHPLVDTVFTLRNIGVNVADIPEIKSGKLKLKPYEFDVRASHFDLMLVATTNDDFITMGFEYPDILFKKSTIAEMAKCYVEILNQVVETPWILLKDIAVTHEFAAVKSNVLKTQDIEFEF